MIKERLEQRANELFEEYYAQYRAAGGSLSEDRLHDTLMGAWTIGRVHQSGEPPLKAKNNWRGEGLEDWAYQKAVQACLDFDETLEMEDVDGDVEV